MTDDFSREQAKRVIKAARCESQLPYSKRALDDAPEFYMRYGCWPSANWTMTSMLEFFTLSVPDKILYLRSKRAERDIKNLRTQKSTYGEISEKSGNIKALLIDPKKREIKEVSIRPEYEELKKILECEITDTAFCADRNHLFIVDDTGMYNAENNCFYLPDLYQQPLAGKALLAGVNDGEMCSHKFSNSDISIMREQSITWHESNELGYGMKL